MTVFLTTVFLTPATAFFLGATVLALTGMAFFLMTTGLMRVFGGEAMTATVGATTATTVGLTLETVFGI